MGEEEQIQLNKSNVNSSPEVFKEISGFFFSLPLSFFPSSLASLCFSFHILSLLCRLFLDTNEALRATLSAVKLGLSKTADRRDNCDGNAKESDKESDEQGDRCPLMYAREVPGREASSVLYVLGDKLFT